MHDCSCCSPACDAPLPVSHDVIARCRRIGRIWLVRSLSPLGLLLCGAQSPAAAQSAAVDEPPQSGALQPSINDPEEIVVTARYGDALVAPETELGEQEIGNYGAGTIGELVYRIAPLIGRLDEQPIVLINGERVDSGGGIYSFPPEALQRLTILPPEAASRYGYSGQQRVVNLVLKKHFIAWQTEAGVTLPTAGGRHGRRLSGGRFVVDGKARWNVQAQMSQDSALLQSERRDGAADRDDSDMYRTLLPASRTLSLNAGITRPLGRFSGSLNFSASRSSSKQLLGLAALPDVSIDDRTLDGNQSSTNLGVSMTLSGPVIGWRANLIARYSRSWSASALDRVDDIGALAAIRVDRLRSRGENLTVQLSANKSLLSLPAGAVTSTISVGASQNRLFNGRSAGGADDPPSIGIERKQIDARLSLGVPVFSARDGGFAAFGDLLLDAGGSASVASNSPLRSRFDLGVTWTPFAALQLRASAGFAQLIPTVDQLNGPYVEDIRRIYDFTAQEIAEPIWITGGNPDLGRGSARSYSLRANLRPFADRQLTLTSEYQRQVATGGVSSFPTLSPAVESAFRERIVRDASGRLVSVDARPISIARDLSERIDSSLTISLLPGASKGGEAAGAIAANAWQASVSINHGWLLRSELLIRPSLPTIDRLRGGTAQSRHSIGFQLVTGRSGMGMTLDGNWQSGFRLRDPAQSNGQRDYRHKSVMILNVRLFAEPERLIRTEEKPAWLSDLHVSFDIQNLFNTYRRVTLGDGSVPAGYERYEVDPLGRTVQLTVRKRF